MKHLGSKLRSDVNEQKAIIVNLVIALTIIRIQFK